MLDDRCSLRIGNDVFRVIGIAHISISYPCSQAFTALALSSQHCPYLIRAVTGVHIVEQVLDTRHFIDSIGGINSVCYCNEAHIICRKYQLHEPVGFQMVASKSRLVFHNDRTHEPILYIIEHMNVLRTSIINSAVTVVDVVLTVPEAILVCVIL